MKNKFYVTDELKRIRLEKGLSRSKLSENTDVSPKTIQRAENGKKVMHYCIENSKGAGKCRWKVF